MCGVNNLSLGSFSVSGLLHSLVEPEVRAAGAGLEHCFRLRCLALLRGARLFLRRLLIRFSGLCFLVLGIGLLVYTLLLVFSLCTFSDFFCGFLLSVEKFLVFLLFLLLSPDIFQIRQLRLCQFVIDAVSETAAYQLVLISSRVETDVLFHVLAGVQATHVLGSLHVLVLLLYYVPLKVA